MLKKKFLVLIPLFALMLISYAKAQVKDTVIKPVDTLITKPIPAVRMDSTKKVDTAKKWGQLYNNQVLNQRLNAKGEKTGHFWQKTYTYSKIGLIYAGFTLLTLSYVDNTNGYRIFLKEAQIREQYKDNAALLEQNRNPDLRRYTNAGVLGNKDVFKRNRQVIIFSYFAVYGINVIDAYVAARLNYFNIDDNLSFKVSPTLLNNPGGMYSFNPAPALKLSFVF